MKSLDEKKVEIKLHSRVMIWINAEFILDSPCGMFARMNGLQLMVRLKVRPPPNATINNMRQSALATFVLVVQVFLHDDTLAGRRRIYESALQVFESVFLQFTRDQFHRPFRVLFVLVWALQTHQSLHHSCHSEAEKFAQHVDCATLVRNVFRIHGFTKKKVIHF